MSFVTIHVCDEAKKVTKDFSCNRELLVAEMKYFESYLTGNILNWKDVDIAVHCDLGVFDWLMKYVHRSVDNESKLSVDNAISILISSDFLQMPDLVEKCLQFCHDHMSAILAIPCNLGCISDQLIKRLSCLFAFDELERVKDKRDKFKSKLFSHKLQEIFDVDHSSRCCPVNASQLYKCIFCQKFLIPRFQQLVKCSPHRMSFDRYGRYTYHHCRDTRWNVNDYLLQLKTELKSWRCVFWRMWALINHLQCRMCGDIFPCAEYNHCRFHPHQAHPSITTAGVDEYPCCQERVSRYEFVPQNKGCSFRCHDVVRTIPTDDAILHHRYPIDSDDGKILYNPDVIECLLAIQNIATLPINENISHCMNEGSERVSLFASFVTQSKSLVSFPPAVKTLPFPLDSMNKNESASQIRSSQSSKRPSHIKHSRSDSTELLGDEEEDSDTEHHLPVAYINVSLTPSSSIRTDSQPSWDASLPLRMNQDNQREQDCKRISEISNRLTGVHLNDNNDIRDEMKMSRGIYHRIERQLKSPGYETNR